MSSVPSNIIRHEVTVEAPLERAFRTVTERTRVVLEHRHLDRHGDGWESVAAGVDAVGGWPLYLRRYRSLLT